MPIRAVTTVLIVVGLIAGAGVPATAGTPDAPAHHGSGALPSAVVKRPAVRAQTTAVLPPAVDLTPWSPAVGDQGSIASCASWAIGYTIAGWYANRLNRPTDFAPMFLYSQVHQSDTPDGGGQYTDDVYRVATTQGIARLADYPQGNYDFRTRPTAAEVAAAAPYRLAPEITLYSGLSAPGPAARPLIEAQLAAGHPVEIAFPVYPAFDRLNAAQWTLHERDVQSATPQGGHAVVVVGYDADGVRIQNQWGTSWGQQGYADLGWDFVEQETLEATTTMGFANALAPVPSAPTAVAVQRGVHAVTVRWRPPGSSGGSAVTGYTVALNSRSVLLPAAARSFTFTGLPAGLPVRISVRASNGTGSGNAVTRTTAAAAPPWAPARVRGITRPGAVTLTWTAPVDDGGLPVTGYTVTRSGFDTAGRTLPMQRLSARNRAIRFSSLGSGRTYVVTIRAVNAAGTSVPFVVHLYP